MTPNTAPFNFDEEIDRRAVPALKTHPAVLGADGAHLFPAGVADMDFPLPQPIHDALQKRLDHAIFGYEAVPSGLMPALTHWLKTRHRWQVDPAHILRAPNVLNSLAIAASLFTKEGEGIIVQPPVFFDFFDIITENKRQLISNPLILENGRYKIDFAGLEKAAAKRRTKMIFLCNPHNPVGRVWTRGELLRLGEICLHNKVLVVSDEIHGDITFAGHPYTPIASLGIAYAKNTIACISPAKSFNIASCCSSFTIIADDAKRKAFQVENSRLTVNKNNAFASVAMEAAYQHGAPWLDRVQDYLAENLTLVRLKLRAIPNVTLIEPDGTFLLWLDFRALELPPEKLKAFLRTKAGWAVTSGPAFGEQGKGFARLNIACPRAKLDRAMNQLDQAVQSLS